MPDIKLLFICGWHEIYTSLKREILLVKAGWNDSLKICSTKTQNIKTEEGRRARRGGRSVNIDGYKINLWIKKKVNRDNISKQIKSKIHD